MISPQPSNSGSVENRRPASWASSETRRIARSCASLSSSFECEREVDVADGVNTWVEKASEEEDPFDEVEECVGLVYLSNPFENPSRCRCALIRWTGLAAVAFASAPPLRVNSYTGTRPALWNLARSM